MKYKNFRSMINEINASKSKYFIAWGNSLLFRYVKI